MTVHNFVIPVRWIFKFRALLLITTVIALMVSSQVLAADAPKKGNTACAKYAVQASAQVQEKPAQIALVWPEEKTAISHTLYRRFLGEKQWSSTPISVLGGNAIGFTDSKVVPGVVYEYRIDRAGNGYIGHGYICAGITLPLVDQRGAVVLIVEKSVAEPLAKELAILGQDLAGDGWQVLRHDVARDMKVTEVKKLIEDEYRRNPEQVRTVFLFGHVPVPYSGSISPDGHTDHRGAWPADLYYGDMTGKWTDEQKLKTASVPSQINEPGDGKFDQSTIPPNILSLEVGRVDLSDLPAFSLDEVGLLRQYLFKNHVFRHGFVQAEERGLINDNFGPVYGEAFAASPWKNFAAFFGAQRIDAADWLSVLPTNGYLWAHANGAGGFDRAWGVGTTADFARMPLQAVFTSIFGSYHGDWDRQNNFMRAALANSGWPLTCAWEGRPHWYFHHMAIGKNIGYSALRTQNNNQLMDYLPSNDVNLSYSGKEDDREWDNNSIHVALLGDPTLRMHPVAPPRQCRISTFFDGRVRVEWAPPTDPQISGFLFYSAPSIAGPFTQQATVPVSESGFAVTGMKPGTVIAIKSLKLQKSGSGTYWNTSQALFIPLPSVGAAYQPPQLSGQALTTLESQPLEFTPQLVGDLKQDATVLVAQSPMNGMLRRLANGHYVYSPTPQWNGTDRFKLIPHDGMNDGVPIEYTVVVKPVPDAPKSQGQKIGLVSDGKTRIRLLATNPDEPAKTLAWKIVTQPKYGKLSGTGPDLSYEPSSNPAKNDSFTFTASNGYLTSEPATVNIVPQNHCQRVATPKVIDGDLTDWGDLPFKVTDPEQIHGIGRKEWQGLDYRFAFGTAYDQTYLYVAVQVIKKDPIVAQKDQSPWEQDGVEIRLNARPVDARSQYHGEGEMTEQLLVALSPSEVLGECWLPRESLDILPEGTKYACRRNPKGYDAEVAIPVSYLNRMAGEEWSGFRLNVAVNFRRGQQQIQCWWMPDWRYADSYWGSGSFVRVLK